MIPQNIIEEVRVRADIVEIVAEHVALKRAGKEYKARCPFHSEKTPSFYVVPAKGFYKCFGCGESGDAFTFLMKRQGLTFQEAVRVVAGRVGVDIPADDERRADEPNRALYEVIAFAADYFQKNLWSEAGERARQYLDTRGITRETAERFG
ncbi:MAG TPA: CHC2 zinc finger domain-containing protein, partial [Longimicrobiales bacterium]